MFVPYIKIIKRKENIAMGKLGLCEEGKNLKEGEVCTFYDPIDELCFTCREKNSTLKPVIIQKKGVENGMCKTMR